MHNDSEAFRDARKHQPPIMPRSEITVVVPVFNGEKYLSDALMSISAQTHPPLEVIVIDDGSTDASVTIAEQANVTVLRQKHQGVSAARNLGIAKAKSKWVAFIDADDVWKPEKLAHHNRASLLAPDVDVVFSDYYNFSDSGLLNLSVLREVHQHFAKCSRKMLSVDTHLISGAVISTATSLQPFALPSTMIVKRLSLLSAGGFDSRLSTDEDTDILLRLVRNSDALFIDQVLTGYRIHATNATSDYRRSRFGMYQLALTVLEHPQLYRPETVVTYQSRLSHSALGAGRAYALNGDLVEARTLLSESVSFGAGQQARFWLIILPMMRLKLVRKLLAVTIAAYRRVRGAIRLRRMEHNEPKPNYTRGDATTITSQ